MDTLKRSRLYEELRWKYLEKRLRIYVAVGILCWLGYIVLLVEQYPSMVVQNITVLTLN